MARYYKISLNGKDTDHHCTEVFEDLKGYDIFPIKPFGGYNNMYCHMRVRHIRDGKKVDVEHALERVINALELHIEYTVQTV